MSKKTQIRPEIQALADRGRITLEEWKAFNGKWGSFKGSSYEYALLLPKLTDEAIIYASELMAKNCQFDQRCPYRSYNKATMGLLVPELLRRLKKLDSLRELPEGFFDDVGDKDNAEEATNERDDGR